MSEPRTNEVAATVGLPDVVHGVGELAGELAHALRNPVATLTTSVELLTGGTTDADDVKQLHRVMKNELAKLTELLSRCREMHRLTTLALAPADLATLVRARVAERRPDCEARSIVLETDVPDAGLAPIAADETQLGASIDALLSNALEALADGGRLTVAVRVEGARAVLTVRDSGAGIPAQVLPNVFRLFYTTRKGAQGLGLSVARQVFYAHGGSIALTSTVGEGTTATVSLPLAK